MPPYETVRLMNNVLNLYYIEGLTQAEIAQRLCLSTAKVNRLVQQARELGYVNISIRTPFQHLFEIEARLKAIFELKEAIVIPAMGESNSSLLNDLGAVAADYLLEHLRDGDVLGIGGGTAINAIFQAMSPTRAYQVDIVPMQGAVQGQMTTDVNYLATHMAERLGGKAYQLLAPAYVETPEQSEALRNMRPVKEILDIARRATVALLGIGTVDAEASRFVQFTALSAADMRHISNDLGGVGEINAIVYDIEGRGCANEYADRVIGLSLDEIKNIQFRIGIAGTAAKSMPLFGALRGGYLHTLITDETAACGILAFFDQNFRNVSQ